MKKIILLVMITIITGCSSSSSKTTICKANQNLDMRITLKSDDNDVIQTISTTVFTKDDMQALGNDFLENRVSEMKELLDFDGIEYAMTKDNDLWKETIIVDYKKVNFDKLEEVGMYVNDANSKSLPSLSDTVENFENYNFKCK